MMRRFGFGAGIIALKAFPLQFEHDTAEDLRLGLNGFKGSHATAQRTTSRMRLLPSFCRMVRSASSALTLVGSLCGGASLRNTAVNQNVLPLPSTLVIPALPPMSSASFCDGKAKACAAVFAAHGIIRLLKCAEQGAAAFPG